MEALLSEPSNSSPSYISACAQSGRDALSVAYHSNDDRRSQVRDSEGVGGLQGVPPETDPFFSEASLLVDALIRGWARAKREEFFSLFEVLSVEKEIRATLAPNVILAARADAVVREKASKAVYVLNWKTCSSTRDWTQRWMEDIQMWTEALATEEAIGEKVAGCIVEGLYKGTKRDGHFSSPLIWGYRKGGSIRATYASGWEKFPITEEFSVQEWIDWLPLEVLNEQFLRSSPIFKNDAVVEGWLKQVVQRETEAEYILKEGTEEDREIFFRQTFSHNNCHWCPFKDVCFKLSTMDELIKAGKVVPREDHHNESIDVG